MKFDWSRFKNYGLWVSILALIPILLNACGVKIVPDEYQVISNTILAILVTLGIISNPTTESKSSVDNNKKNDSASLEKDNKENL